MRSFPSCSVEGRGVGASTQADMCLLSHACVLASTRLCARTLATPRSPRRLMQPTSSWSFARNAVCPLRRRPVHALLTLAKFFARICAIALDEGLQSRVRAPIKSNTKKRITKMAKTKKSRNRYSVSPPKEIQAYVYSTGEKFE